MLLHHPAKEATVSEATYDVCRGSGDSASCRQTSFPIPRYFLITIKIFYSINIEYV